MRLQHAVTIAAVVTKRYVAAESGESPVREHVRQVRLPRHLPHFVLHLHHDHRSQHHLRHHRRHFLRAQEPQGQSTSSVYVGGGNSLKVGGKTNPLLSALSSFLRPFLFTWPSTPIPSIPFILLFLDLFLSSVGWHAHAPFTCQRWRLPHKLAQCATLGMGLV